MLKLNFEYTRMFDHTLYKENWVIHYLREINIFNDETKCEIYG